MTAPGVEQKVIFPQVVLSASSEIIVFKINFKIRTLQDTFLNRLVGLFPTRWQAHEGRAKQLATVS